MIKQSLRKITQFSFIRFCLVGGTLFITDASILYFLMYLGLKPNMARLISASCSVTASWLMHRNYTFSPSNKTPIKEYKIYVLGSLISFTVNLSIYVILIETWQLFWRYPILALIAATATSMNISYLFMKNIVFLKK